MIHHSTQSQDYLWYLILPEKQKYSQQTVGKNNKHKKIIIFRTIYD